MTNPASTKLRRAVNMLRKMHDEGFEISTLVEVAMAGRAPYEMDAIERGIVLDLYREEIGEKPKSEARLRGERAMREFLAEKAAAAEAVTP